VLDRPGDRGQQEASRDGEATDGRLHRRGWLALVARMRGTTALALLVTVWAPVAVAQVTEANSTTVLRLEPDWQPGTSRFGAWGTEFVGVSVRGVDIPGVVEDLRFQLSGWLTGAVIADPTAGLFTGDVSLLYLQGSFFHRHLSVILGRQLISGGAARVLQLDGLNATVTFGKGFGVSGYMGAPTRAPPVAGPGVDAYVAAPTVTRDVVPLGNFAFGGRAFWRPSFGTEVGVSFLEILSNGVIAQQNLGVDASVAILSNLSLTASSVLSLVEWRVADAELGLSWQVRPTLELFVNGTRSEPDLFLPSTSIFTVFAYTERTAVGGGVTWKALPRLSLYGAYNQLWVDGGSGNQGDLRATYRIGSQSTLGFNATLLLVPVNGYTELRGWFIQSLTQRIKLSADLDWQLLEHALNQARDSVVGTASVSWAIGSGWSAMLSGSVGTTPLYLARYTLTARVGYNFTTLDRGAPR
jgi:hypothetical protein